MDWGVHAANMGLCYSNDSPRFESQARAETRRSGQRQWHFPALYFTAGAARPFMEQNAKGARWRTPLLTASENGNSASLSPEINCTGTCPGAPWRTRRLKTLLGKDSSEPLFAPWPLAGCSSLAIRFNTTPSSCPGFDHAFATLRATKAASRRMALSPCPNLPGTKPSPLRWLCNTSELGVRDSRCPGGILGGLPPERCPRPPGPAPREPPGL